MKKLITSKIKNEQKKYIKINKNQKKHITKNKKQLKKKKKNKKQPKYIILIKEEHRDKRLASGSYKLSKA